MKLQIANKLACQGTTPIQTSKYEHYVQDNQWLTMKNSNAVRPRPQELNETIRKVEDIHTIQLNRLMVEPKFDGSFIYITQDRATGHTVLCTRDGNELRLEPTVHGFLMNHFNRWTDGHLFEAELEPFPWSEEAKARLNGNLYTGKPMNFRIRIVIHDLLGLDEMDNPKTTAWERYRRLLQLAGKLGAQSVATPVPWAEAANATVSITPCELATPAEAARLFAQGWEAGRDRRRVIYGGHPYEGMVLINPKSVYKAGRSNKWKVKPFHTLDLCVTQLEAKTSGKTSVFEVRGEDLKSGQSVRVFSGIGSEQYEELQAAAQHYRDVIIEVEALALKELPNANPTFKTVRYDRMEPKFALEIT